MLVLSRSIGEIIDLDVPGISRIQIEVMDIRGGPKVRLGIEAPKFIAINRHEVTDARDRVIQNTPQRLCWDFDREGEWEAFDSEGYAYRIQVCDDGTFDISRSDSELGLRDRETFSTLTLAKFACEAAEADRAERERDQRQSVT